MELITIAAIAFLIGNFVGWASAKLDAVNKKLDEMLEILSECTFIEEDDNEDGKAN